MAELHVVTGAFGFSGHYIARRLLDAGADVRTLTNHPRPADPLFSRVSVAPLTFSDSDQLVASLRGARALYNTYWIRFEYGGETFAQAVRNSVALVRAAEAAGVGKIVHVSITNPSEDSLLPYFRGKAAVERMLRESSIPHAILRPAVLFGRGDILINNIAWLLRRFPLFLVPGSGRYLLRPIHVDDLAALAVRHGASEGTGEVIDAVGPEQPSFNELVALLKRVTRSRSLVRHAPSGLALRLSGVIGAVLRDVVLTPDEVHGLASGVLESPGPPVGQIPLSEWLRRESSSIGRRYASEVARHYR